jgi:hypothetical protein
MLRATKGPVARLAPRATATKRSYCIYAYGTRYERSFVSGGKMTFQRDISMASLSSLEPIQVTALNSKIVCDSINKIRYQGYNNPVFIIEFYSELFAFQKFLHDTNGISQFDQLSCQDLICEVFKFKTQYHNGVYPVSDIDRFDKFVEVFVDKLTNPITPLCLSEHFTNFKDYLVINDLYKHGIGNFLRELKSLSHEFDFDNMTTIALSKKIGDIIEQFERYYEMNYTKSPYNSIVDSHFFEILIQLNRYKSLKGIFDKYPNLQIDHLKDIIQDKNAITINQKIRDLSCESDVINEHVDLIRPMVQLLQTELDFEFDHPFTEYAPLLYDISRSEVEPKIKNACDKILETLLPLFYDGLISTEETNYLFERLSNPEKSTVYVQIPDDMDFTDDISTLIQIRAVLQSDFKSKTPDQILDSLKQEAFRGDGFKLMELYHKLNRLFLINNGHTEVLDTLLFNADVFSKVESSIQSKNKFNNKTPAIETTDLKQYTYQLQILKEQVLGRNFEEFTSEEIVNKLEAAIIKNELLEEDVTKFAQLCIKLRALFERNNGDTKVLDELLTPRTVNKISKDQIPSSKLEDQNNNIISKSNIPASKLGENEGTTGTINEIPSELQLDLYIRELKIVRDEFLGKPFSSFNAEDISTVLANQINHIYSSTSSPSINNDNVLNFIRLHKRLNRLFKVNKGNCGVLDKLLNAHMKDDEIDVELSPKYVQIPESLPVHSFVPELEKLREELGNRFASFTANDVDKKLSDLIDNILNKTGRVSRVTTENVHLFIKLRQVLSKLFATNGGNTEILDAVIFSNNAFENFENSLTSKRSYRALPDEFHLEEYVSELKELRSRIGSSFANASTENILAKTHELATLINSVEEKRIWNNLYRNLALLFHHNHNHGQVLDNVVLNSEQFEKFELKKSGGQKEIIEPNDEIVTMSLEDENLITKPELSYEGKPFEDLNADYNDSERLLAALIKQSEPADIKEICDKITQENAEEFVIKDAVSIAMNNDPDLVEEYEELRKTSWSPSPQGHNKLKMYEESTFADVNKESLELFLKRAKTAKETAKNRKSRELEAYEWSKNMLNSHRSLESHDFFDISKDLTGESLLFPTSGINEAANVEYTLLTIEGDVIPTNVDLIGKLPKEDIFQILNKFEKNDLDLFVEQFKKLQKDNWKVIGSKINNVNGTTQKYLILSRTNQAPNTGMFSKIKTIFATAGAVFVSMVCANILLDDRHSKDPLPIEDSNSNVPNEQAMPPKSEDAPQQQSGGWKKWFWKD